MCALRYSGRLRSSGAARDGADTRGHHEPEPTRVGFQLIGWQHQIHGRVSPAQLFKAEIGPVHASIQDRAIQEGGLRSGG